MKPYRIEYGNDTGAHDDYFVEFWDVTNDEKSFRCESEEEANNLLKILESHAELLEALKGMNDYFIHDKELKDQELSDLLDKAINAVKKATE